MNLRTWSITQAVNETGIPRATLYALLESGKVQGNRPSVRGRWRVLISSLQAWLEHTPAMPTPSAPSPASRDRQLEQQFGIRGEDRVFG